MKRTGMALVATMAMSMVPLAMAQSPAKPSDAEIAKVLDSIYGIQPSFSACVQASSDRGVANIDCEQQELVFQDKRLNRAYVSLMTKLDVAQKAKLKDAEKAWMRYRDTYCSADFDGNGRPPLDEASCRMYETAKQADFLESRLLFQ